MRTADKIGLLPGFGWVADHSWWVTFLICLAIVPFGLWAIQLLIMGRGIKLDHAHNYLSFFPGDIFLGNTAASMLYLGRFIPAEQRWYNSREFHWTMFCLCFAGALFMTWLDLHGGGFTIRTILEPTKIYHNIFVYWLYAYLILTSYIAVTAAGGWLAHWQLNTIAALGLILWAVMVMLDSSFSAAVSASGDTTVSPAAIKAALSTPSDWRFFDAPRRWWFD